MIFANTEFYYSTLKNNNEMILEGDEVKHLANVMRHKLGDSINVTNGNGIVYVCEIIEINKKLVRTKIVKVISVLNKFKNITFFIPILKSTDRLEFALEKCVELGITSFIIYNAEKSYKRGIKIDRWNKILISAMKQSLRAFKPTISFIDNLRNVTNSNQQQYYYLDQLAETSLSIFLKNDTFYDKSSNFIFGPEGGNTKKDLENLNNTVGLKLTDSRLRSETAIVTTASIISLL